MSFSAIVLEKESRDWLLGEVREFIPAGWELVAHHCTLEFPADSHPEEGEIVDIVVDTIAFDDKVVAVGVNKDHGGGRLSKNPIPHITVAVNRENGGKPVMSNDLKDWQRIPRSYTVFWGKITICK